MIKLRLKEILNSKGVSQARIARELGVTPMTVSGWITGRRYPSIDTLDRLATMLNVDITAFFAATLQPQAYTLQARIGNRTIDLTDAIINALTNPSATNL